MLGRDAGRFAAARRAAGELPLGSGALAGLNWDLDRDGVARDLGFESVDAQLARRRLEPRLRARLPLRRVDLRDAPLAARRGDRALVERRVLVLRGRRGASPPARASCRRRRTPTRRSCCGRRRPRICSSFLTLAGVMHGLPLAYSQGPAGGQGGAVRRGRQPRALPRGRGAHASRAELRPRAAGGGRRATSSPAATDVADLLVRKGMPFREAHGVVGGLVRDALEQGKALSELTPDDLRRHSELLDDSYYEVLASAALAGVEGLGRRDGVGPGRRAARGRPGGPRRAAGGAPA